MSSIEKWGEQETFTTTAGKSITRAGVGAAPIVAAAALLPGGSVGWTIGSIVVGGVLWVLGQKSGT